MIEDKKTNLPDNLLHVYHVLEKDALDFINKKDFESAQRKYKELLSKLIEAQGSTIRYHKGGPYHQIGYIYFLQRKSSEAFKYFIFAYIEDCITGNTLPMDWAAFKNLKIAYGISFHDLEKLFQSTRKYYVENTVPQIAEDYYSIYILQGNRIEPIHITKHTKVFIGGNYRNIALLRYIEGEVSKIGKNKLSPILAVNFSNVSNEQIYQHSMYLLEDCGYAIFEVTFDSGHLMEIERALSKLIPKENMLLVHQTPSKHERKSHYITKMLLGHDIKVEGYSSLEELTEYIEKFITKMTNTNA
jgi:hypothetical protein